MEIVKCFNVEKCKIVLFVYCLDLEVFWVYLFSRNVFVKYDGRGNDLDICIFNVKIGNVCNKLVCVVDNEKFFFRYNVS